MDMERYDLAVIGAGAGGLNASFEALMLGKKVVLIDKYKPGGECTWSGCIPSKALIQIADEVHTAKKYGDIEINRKQILTKVRTLIETAHQAEAVEVLEEAGIDYLQGYAKFKNAHTLDVDGKEIQADKVVIATGSSALIPSIKGIENVDYLTNENVFLLEDLPKDLIILGAGAIGVELAQAFQRLGVQVKLVEMAETILFREEKDMALELESILKEEGVECFTSAKGVEVRAGTTGITLTIEQNGGQINLTGEKILLALGRKPNVEGINLDKIGVQYNHKGVEVNEYLETTVPNVYAVGDIVGPYLFSHMGGAQGKQAVQNAFSAAKGKINYNQAAWCTFTHPELARAGMTEDEAKAKHDGRVQVYTQAYSELDRAVVDEKTKGMAKVICDEEGYILGASILGERACELLSELQVVKSFHIPFYKLQEAIHPYPSYSEILLQLSKEAYNNQ
ncbi:mercuric reductase [Bacillaceae bacterium SAOS 7]|nr:mercuric reductase [Bacillaceae bacterium SAOS 7]